MFYKRIKCFIRARHDIVENYLEYYLHTSPYQVREMSILLLGCLETASNYRQMVEKLEFLFFAL